MTFRFGSKAGDEVTNKYTPHHFTRTQHVPSVLLVVVAFVLIRIRARMDANKGLNTDAPSADGGACCPPRPPPPSSSSQDVVTAKENITTSTTTPTKRLRRVQDAQLEGKVVLVRVDHNCVKGGTMSDAFRVDATIATLYNIVERGGRPILMTHVGRPYDKKTRTIQTSEADAVTPVVRYLQHKLGVVFAVPEFRVDPSRGIVDVDTSVNWLIQDLRARRIGGVYLPNTRWFEGEEGLAAGYATDNKGGAAADAFALAAAETARLRFAQQLAGLADVFVNDAFGSWQPHTSTLGIARLLPSYAGLLMQKEVAALKAIIEPRRPFLAVIAGSKLDTKIGTIRAVAERADHVMLGGQLYNAYVAAKRGVHVAGVTPEDVELARRELCVPEVERKLAGRMFLFLFHSVHHSFHLARASAHTLTHPPTSSRRP